MSQQAPPPSVHFVLQNVCGLTGRKLVDMLSWLREKQAHGAVLTETCATSDPADLLRRLPGAGAFWPGARFFYCPGTGHTQGVTIILGPDCHLTEPTQFAGLDGGGRVLRLDLQLLGKPACLIGAYAPAQTADRRAFFEDVLPAYLPADDTPVLLGMDANCVLDLDLDCVHGRAIPASTSRSIGASSLRGLMDRFTLRDIWREQHVQERAFTHWSAPAGSGARLDRWLASSSFLDTFRATSTIVPAAGVTTDHLPVSLFLKSASRLEPRGKGIYAFPLQMLSIPGAVQELGAVLHVQAQGILHGGDDGVVQRWDKAKEAIRREAILIHRRHRALRRSAVRQAEDAALRALDDLVRGAPTGQGDDLLAAWQQAARSAAREWQEIAGRTYGAAQTLDHLFSDTSSYYFHSQARQPTPPTVIKTLNRPGRDPADPPGTADLANQMGVNAALRYAADFYASDSPCGLFRPNPNIDSGAQQELLETLSRRLTPDLAVLAEGLDGDSLLTEEDFGLALAASQRGSAPGYDGLPYEFYRTYKETLVPVLLKVFNAAFRDAASASPLSPLLAGVICLIHKSGQPADELSGYRPITLLNCDVKLVMLIMSNRLQRPLDYLIDITQSAFITGRDISDNVRYHLGLAARLEELGLPAWLLHSDLTKAYDSVGRAWLFGGMQAMGFREAGIVRWCQILLKGSSSSVRVNGFLTPFFDVTSGLFQGSSLSCQEWVIVLQPLVSYLTSLQHTGRLASFQLPSGRTAPAALAHADDTKLVVLQPDTQGHIIRDAFNLSRRAGNPAQSAAKTVFLHLSGNVPPTLDPALTARHVATDYRIKLLTEAPHRLLGVPFTQDAVRAVSAAYGSMAGAMQQASRAWATLRPTALGRAHVAMQCLASKAVYMFNFVTPDRAAHLAPMQRAVNGFVAATGRHEEESPFNHTLHPRFAVARLPCNRGGLGLPDLSTHALAMRAKPAWLAFLHTQHPWVDLFIHEVAAARAHRPDLPPGHHWIVTCPDDGGSAATITTPYVRDAVDAFRQLRVKRIMEPRHQDFDSVMLEHTFARANPPHHAGLDASALASATGRTWLRLSQVRAAWQARASLAADVLADLHIVLSAIPQPWKAAVTDHQTPDPLWAELFSQEGAPSVFEGPDPQSGEQRLWELWPGGRLHPLSYPFVRPHRTPRSALVDLRPKPKLAWVRADWEYHEEQMQLPREEREELQEPWLVGVWEEMQLDPRVWGLEERRGQPAVSLLRMEVKDARCHLGHLAAHEPSTADAAVEGYSQSGAAWPAIWATTLPGTVGDVTGAGERALRQMGLTGMEERWRRSVLALQQAEPAHHIDVQPAWLRPPGEVAAARPSPEDRHAARDAPADPAAALAEGFEAVWPRLCDPTLHRPFRITCWRMLHGCLGCNAFLAHVRSKARAQGLAPSQDAALCQAACCLSGTRPLETLTHAFLDCPEAAPVVDWLRESWFRLSGVVVPRTARVLLADDPGGWPGAPRYAKEYQLWTRLRVATLGSIWRVRCARDEGGGGSSFAHKAARMAMESVIEAIRRDWGRTQQEVRTLDDGAFCTDWWRGFDGLVSISAFEKQWATPPYFCRLLGQPPADPRVPDTRTMELLLSLSYPVPIPPALQPAATTIAAGTAGTGPSGAAGPSGTGASGAGPSGVGPSAAGPSRGVGPPTGGSHGAGPSTSGPLPPGPSRAAVGPSAL